MTEPRHAYETAERCPDCETPLIASPRGTWRACGPCKYMLIPATAAAPYEHGTQRQVVSQHDRDLEALALAGRKGALLGQLRRMTDIGLDDESQEMAEWFAGEVKSASGMMRLDSLVVLFTEAGIRTGTAPVITAGDSENDENDGYRPAPPPPRLAIVPPPAPEPDWQWALRELGWDASTPLYIARCHITSQGARCDGEAVHNIGIRHGVQVFACDPHYAVLAKTITAEQRRRA